MASRSDLIAIEPLEALLDANGLGSGPIEAKLIGEGHSNVTYRVRRAGADLVLRRPPRPPIEPSAHDVLREARILRALESTKVPAPRVRLTCDDEGVLGVPFYVMDHIEGDVITREVPAALASPDDRWATGMALVDALVALHGVDWREVGLERLGRATGYLERQLRTFGRLWEANKTRELPRVTDLADWLAERCPKSSETTIVHGDYRTGNVMFARTSPVRLVAIFDWEMATLGDPLADLGYLVATYGARETRSNVMSELSAATRDPGFPRVRDLVDRYERRTGRSTAALPWYTVLALWKSCVFLEGLYKRYQAGGSDDRWLAGLDSALPELADHAWRLARNWS